jgi:DNA-binding GntR family transcriptional regulator
MPDSPSQHRTPLYFRIQQGILEQIQAGQLQPGGSCPRKPTWPGSTG